MIRYVSDVWNKIHRTKILNTWSNIFFIKQYFLNTKAISNDMIFFIMSSRALTAKSLKFNTLSSFVSTSFILFFLFAVLVLSIFFVVL